MPDVIEGQEGGVDVSQVARDIAASVVAKGMPPVAPPVAAPGEPGTPAPEGVGVPPEGVAPVEGQVGVAPAEGVPTTPEGGEAGTVTEGDVEEIVEETGLPFTDVVDALQELGIAVDTEGIPEELYDSYGRHLESTRSAVLPLVEQLDEARTAQQQLAMFKERLNDRPESVLLTLWATKPDAFAKVAEMAQRAIEDEQFRDNLRHEIEVEAREARVSAQETQVTRTQLEAKGRRASALTDAAARRYGVAKDVAQKYVAGMIGASGEQFNLSEIDGLVQQLRPAAPKKKVVRMVTPEAAKAAQTTPTVPAGTGVAPAAADKPGASSGLDAESAQPGRGGFLRGLVKAAGARVDQQG